MSAETGTARKAKTNATNGSQSIEGAIKPAYKGFNPSEYSAAHTEHIALMDWYFTKIREQEDMYVKAGFPAEGLTDFLAKWFYAWEQRSVELLRECMTDDMVYADPTGGSVDWTAGQVELMDLCHCYYFRVAPDAVFYPQDKTQRALPYYDFLDGQVRITVPWRIIAKPRISFRTFDGVGVDRYNMVRDPDRGWLISRIDTDADLFYALGQLLPIQVKAPSQATVRRVLSLVGRVLPKMRGPRVRPFVFDQSAS